MLKDVFLNILSNAYKYTNPGGKVNMRLEEIECDREEYVLYKTTITDTGIGMSEEYFPHMFEEFSREHNTTDNKIEGTGLGMPIVKRLVEFMDGIIEVHSEKNVGTTVTVCVPALSKPGRAKDAEDEAVLPTGEGTKPAANPGTII